MPRFIKAQDIPMKKRKPHLDRYRRQLRDALLNPGLTATDRAKVKTKLDELGKPKIYAGNPGPIPGTTPTPVPAATAAEPALSEQSDPTPVADADSEPNEIPDETLDDLLALPKDELLAKADAEGVEVFKSWNMDKIAHTILDHRAATE